MKISVVQSVAEALFRYHSGKYATLPLVEELRRSIKEYPSIGAVSIKASAGRDLMFSVYTRNTFHGMVDHTRRPAVPQPDKNIAGADHLGTDQRCGAKLQSLA